MFENSAKTNVYINGADAGKNLRSLRKEARQLRAELSGLSPGTDEFVEKAKRLKEVEGSVRNINQELSGLGRTMGGMKSQMGSLTKVAAGLFAVDRVISWGREVVTHAINTRREFGKLEAVLTNTLGSKSAAQKSLKDIKEFAAATPFSVAELTAAYVKLTNQGFKPTMEEMTNLGDLASAMGKSFDQLTEAIIDAQTGEFERLKEFGIRASKEGDKVTFTFKGVQTQVDFTNESIQQYILGLGDLQGVSGGMAAISQELDGKMSNLGDKYDNFGDLLGKKLAPQIEGTIKFFGRLLDGVSSLIDNTPTASEQLRVLQQEINLEAGALTGSNLRNEDRVRLIGEINSKYKDYLPYLLDESASLEQIQKFQKDINKEMEARILYQAYEEELTKMLKEQAVAAEGIYQANKEAAKIRVQANTQDINPNQVKAMEGMSLAFAKMNEQIIKDGDKNKAEIEEKYTQMAASLGIIFDDLRKRMSSKEEEVVKATAVVDKTRIKELERLKAEILKMQEDMYLESIINEEERELARIEHKYEKLIEQAGEETELLKQLEELKLQEISNVRNKYFLMWADQEFKAMEDEKKSADKRLGIEKSLQDGKADLLDDGISSLQSFFEESSGIYKALFLAEKVNTVATIFMRLQQEIASLAAANALLGPAGIPLTAAQTTQARIRAAIGVATVAAQSFQGFAEGGFTGSGIMGLRDSSGFKVAGVVHEHEYVIPKWMMEMPQVANITGALEAIRSRGFAEGGFTSINQSSGAAPSSIPGFDFDRLSTAIESLIEASQRPSIAVFDNRTTRVIRRQIENDMDNEQLNTF
jgi:hypothetical protein